MCNLYMMFYTEADNADFFTCAGSQQTRNAYSDIADKKLMELDREASQKSSEGVKEPKSFDNSPPSHRCVERILALIITVPRVSVQGVESLGGHFATLYREFDFYEVNFFYYFSKRKGKYLYTFNHFYSEKSSKRAK